MIGGTSDEDDAVLREHNLDRTGNFNLLLPWSRVAMMMVAIAVTVLLSWRWLESREFSEMSGEREIGGAI